MRTSRHTPLTKRSVHLFVMAFAMVIFGYRGWDGHRSLLYLDEVFFQREFNVEDSFSFPLTLVRPFSGYLHLVATTGFAVFPRLSFTYLPATVFLFSTLVWSLCALLIFNVVRNVSSTIPGLAAAVSFCLLPASNIILLSQLNALQWPMLSAAVIAASLGYSPKSPRGSVLYCSFLVLTALNAALTFMVIFSLLIQALRLRSRIQFIALGCTSTAFSIQIAAYAFQRVTNRGRPIDSLSLRYFFSEWSYIYKTLLPGSLRGSTLNGLTISSLIMLCVLWSILLIILLLAYKYSSKSHQHVVHSTALLLLIGLIVGLISVAMNGNLNHQYLMIPLCTFWVAIFLSLWLLFKASWSRSSVRGLSVVSLAIFSFAYSPTWPKDLNDPFFTKPGMTQWKIATDNLQVACNEGGKTARLELSSTSFTVSCSLL